MNVGLNLAPPPDGNVEVLTTWRLGTLKLRRLTSTMAFVAVLLIRVVPPGWKMSDPDCSCSLQTVSGVA